MYKTGGAVVSFLVTSLALKQSCDCPSASDVNLKNTGKMATHKGQWRGTLMFSLICVRINGWVINREAGDMRRHRAHYDIIVMTKPRKNHQPCTKFLKFTKVALQGLKGNDPFLLLINENAHLVPTATVISQVTRNAWRKCNLTHCGRVTHYGDGCMLCKSPIFFTMK